MLPSVAEKEKKDMAERVIKAALLGFGTVGGGVYKVLKNCIFIAKFSHNLNAEVGIWD